MSGRRECAIVGGSRAAALDHAGPGGAVNCQKYSLSEPDTTKSSVKNADDR